MASFDLVLRGGQVVNHDGVVTADVAIQGETVAAIVKPGSDLQTRETIDVTGKRLFPGGVDPHTHMTNRRPVPDSYVRETPGLVLGGTTTAIDFLKIEASIHELAPIAIEAVGTHSYVDLAFHATVQNELHMRELSEYAERYGITSTKMYNGAADWRLYPTTLAIHDGVLWQTLLQVAKMGPNARAMIHAENWEIAKVLSAELEAAGRRDAAAWTEGRPNLCEVDCLYRIAFLAQSAGCSMYGVHLSVAEAPAILRESRGKGLSFYGETCPHYLMIHKDHPMAMLGKYCPAIKAKEDNEALWEAVIDGTIDCIGSDHIPLRLRDKLMDDNNIWKVSPGVPGSGTILPVMIHEGIGRRGMSPQRVAAVTSYNPARIFGIYPQKGHIAIDADADIVVSDPKRTVTVTPDLLDVDFTLFDGEEFTGWPEMTILRGQVVARDGRLLRKPGGGRYLARSL